MGGPQLGLGWALTRHTVGSDPASNTPDDAAQAQAPPSPHGAPQPQARPPAGPVTPPACPDPTPTCPLLSRALVRPPCSHLQQRPRCWAGRFAPQAGGPPTCPERGL